MTEIIPYLFYRDVAAASAFLSRVFGFSEALRVAAPGGGVHVEMTLDGQTVMMGQTATSDRTDASPGGGATAGVFIYLDDVDAHYDHAAEHGAQIEQTPHTVSYGRTYTARDPEGHPWYFTTRGSSSS